MSDGITTAARAGGTGRRAARTSPVFDRIARCTDAASFVTDVCELVASSVVAQRWEPPAKALSDLAVDALSDAVVRLAKEEGCADVAVTAAASRVAGCLARVVVVATASTTAGEDLFGREEGIRAVADLVSAVAQMVAELEVTRVKSGK